MLQVQSGRRPWAADPRRREQLLDRGVQRLLARRQPTLDPNVSISAITKMALFTNATSANPKFYLARVPSWARGQFLTLSFFDIGDVGNGSGDSPRCAHGERHRRDPRSGWDTRRRVRQLHLFASGEPRQPATDYIAGSQRPWDPVQGRRLCGQPALADESGRWVHCAGHDEPDDTVSFWNGKWVTWKIHDPERLHVRRPRPHQVLAPDPVRLPGRTLFHDATTWTASLSGNPVRLTK